MTPMHTRTTGSQLPGNPVGAAREIVRGHARVEATRFGSFLVIGGVATALNLAVLGLLTLAVRWAYLPAAVVALEAGVLLSFILNDRLTFSALAVSAGGWIGRCLRFHGAYAVGQTLIIGIGFLLIHLAHLPVLLAQAGATAVVTLFNFGVLRTWAYRRRSTKYGVFGK